MEDFAFRKEQFAVLYASYARVYERFLENGFKTSTVLLVVLGWLLTSDKARDYLSQHSWAVGMCAALVVTGAVSLCAAFHRLYRLSQLLRKRLDALSFVEAQYYEQHHIPALIYLSVIGQNLFACLLILFLFGSLIL